MKPNEIEPENCPEPFWHDTHRYCPACSWTEPSGAIPTELTPVSEAIVQDLLATIDALQARLAAAEAERDSARADALLAAADVAERKIEKARVAWRQADEAIFRRQAERAEAERNALKARLAATEAVVEAARMILGPYSITGEMVRIPTAYYELLRMSVAALPTTGETTP